MGERLLFVKVILTGVRSNWGALLIGIPYPGIYGGRLLKK